MIRFNPFRREPRRLHAEDLQLITWSIDRMSDALNRLTASVQRVIDDVATEIRNHPAAQNDDGALNGLADKLDGVSASIEAANPAPVDPAPVDPAPAGEDPQPAA